MHYAQGRQGAVLEMLRSHAGFKVLLIKNRLMLAFDASVSGGYRDLLLNLRCLATGHIVELQITLKGLIDVKAGGGHANYAIARVHRLFERDTYRYEGALGDAVLEGVRCGVVRELVCRGTASGLAAHFGRLLAALRSPSCGLSELRLVGCDWPEGRTLSELVDALPATGLKTLAVSEMKVGGRCPRRWATSARAPSMCPCLAWASRAACRRALASAPSSRSSSCKGTSSRGPSPTSSASAARWRSST